MLDILADFVLMLHFAVVLFVVGGLVLVVAGNFLGWNWVNLLWFRLLHLVAIGTVVAQAWFGVTCSLTILESWLRMQTGAEGYQTGFIEHWLHQLLFYEAQSWVFTLAYTVFGLMVVASWWVFPPKRGHLGVFGKGFAYSDKMNLRAFFRQLFLTCLTVSLLALSWGILDGGVRQFPLSISIGQQIETVVQMVCGLLTLLIAITSFWWREWAEYVQMAWVGSVTSTAALSALVWGPPMPLISLVFGALTLLLSLGTVWVLRRLSKPLPSYNYTATYATPED